MTLRSIHLRKILKILFLPPNGQVTALRGDIRDDIARESGDSGGGGDFYAPFWFDAKGHALGSFDLHQCVEERIAANAGRANLYPQLRDGFLVWWNERRRFTNEPFHPGTVLRTHFTFPGIDAIVKVDSILSIRDGRDVEHFVYPYFAPEPILSDEAARLGLWLLIQALPNIPADEIRILDVIRGKTYSIDRFPLHGDEEYRFRDLYSTALRRWTELRLEYQ